MGAGQVPKLLSREPEVHFGCHGSRMIRADEFEQAAFGQMEKNRVGRELKGADRVMGLRKVRVERESEPASPEFADSLGRFTLCDPLFVRNGTRMSSYVV